jgi:hypothetical protein
MAKFDLRLLAPTRDQLSWQLFAATEAANSPKAIIAPFAVDWGQVLDSLQELPQGRRVWSDTRHGDTAFVCLTWWTDRAGRRHHRITAANSRDVGYQLPENAKYERNSPLWYIYPERMFYRVREDLGAWLNVCDHCGMVGSVRALGWMGETCGPCHDRREEGLSLEPVPLPDRFKHHGSAQNLVLWPDGRSCASVVAPAPDLALIRVTDRMTGEFQDIASSRTGPEVMFLSQTGYLIIGWDATRREYYDPQTREMIPESKYNPMNLFSRIRLEYNRQVFLDARPSEFRNSEERFVECVQDEQTQEWLYLTELDFVAWATYPPEEVTGKVRRATLRNGRVQLIETIELRGTRSHEISPDGRYVVGIEPQENLVRVMDLHEKRIIGSVGWDIRERIDKVIPVEGKMLAILDRLGNGKWVPWGALLSA